MRTFSAIAGSAAFFIAAPGVVAGLVPWLLTDRWGLPWSSLPGFVPVGGLLIVAAALCCCMPSAALRSRAWARPLRSRRPRDWSIGGIYRHVRNPMYVAVLSIILGQALLFSSWTLVAYAVIGAIAMVSFVRLYEEPTLGQPLRRRIRDLPPQRARLAATPDALAGVISQQRERQRGRPPGWISQVDQNDQLRALAMMKSRKTCSLAWFFIASG